MKSIAPLKILQIAPPWVDTPPTGYGGTEWVIYNLIKGLTHLDQEVTLYATKKSITTGQLLYSFETALLDKKLRWEAALPSLLHYHQAFKLAPEFDIVHAHLSSQTDLMLLPFMADLYDQGIPAVMTIHSPQPYDRFSGMDRAYIQTYAHKVPIINISESMACQTPEAFIDMGVIHNSINGTIEFNPQGGNYLTWLGQIIPEKGLHTAIEVALETGEQLVFAGMVDRNQYKSVNYFKKKIRPFIDGEQIVYKGSADVTLKNELLGNAKAFLNPIAWEEPFGMVMVESMAAGTPVISFNRGSAEEIIVDGKNGFLVEDKVQMIEAVSKVSTINRADCRAHVKEHFSPISAAEKHLAIYHKLIRQKQKSPQEHTSPGMGLWKV